MVAEWMHSLYGAVRVERLSPPVASRLFAYATIGLYSGMAGANPTLPSLAGRLNGLASVPRGDSTRTYDETLTAVAAERLVLDSLFRDGLATTRAALDRLADSLTAARVAKGVNESLRTRSDSLGRSVGLAIVAWSHGDGFDSTRGKKYVAPVGPGLWVNDSPVSTYTTQNVSGISQVVVPANPTNARRGGSASDRGLILDRQKAAGPTTLPAVNMAGVTEPYWGHNRPFALATWDECPAPPPPAYSPNPGTPLYEEAKHVWEVGKALTPDQKTIALYWADNGGESGTPAGHWLSIGSQMVAEKHLSAEQAAWMMARDGRLARRRVRLGVGLQVQAQRDSSAHVHSRDDGFDVGARDPDAAVPRVSLGPLGCLGRGRWGADVAPRRGALRGQHEHPARPRRETILIVPRGGRRGGACRASTAAFTTVGERRGRKPRAVHRREKCTRDSEPACFRTVSRDSLE